MPRRISTRGRRIDQTSALYFDCSLGLAWRRDPGSRPLFFGGHSLVALDLLHRALCRCGGFFLHGGTVVLAASALALHVMSPGTRTFRGDKGRIAVSDPNRSEVRGRGRELTDVMVLAILRSLRRSWL